jgi:hypothetical protein
MYLRLIAFLSFLIAAGTAEAATIEVTPIAAPNSFLVSVAGPFEFADIELFRTKTLLLPSAIVSFSSDGGSIVAATEIGTSIRLRNFATLVVDGARCASACALAWLGGSKRYLGPNALVGFHAAYIVKDGAASETSIGNALVGAYLSRIGLNDRAVVYITQASPSEMTWLKPADAAQLGIELALLPPNDTQLLPAPKAQSVPAAPDLSAEEIDMADRLARNFDKRYKEAGIAGLNVSIPSCYQEARESRRWPSAEYCIALDFLTTQIDLFAAKTLKIDQMEFNRYDSASARAATLVQSTNGTDGMDAYIGRAKAVAERALTDMGAERPQEAAAPPPEASPTMSGLKIGDPVSNVSTLGLAPRAATHTGPFTVTNWTFADGNQLSVTGSAQGAIVYIEANWGNQPAGAVSDFPDFTYGKTTLAAIRQKFGSNGFAFERHGGAVKVADGVVLINSYEVGTAVATFVTKITGPQARIANIPPDQAVLVAMSLADPKYADGAWGRRSYDANYRPIAWR